MDETMQAESAKAWNDRTGTAVAQAVYHVPEQMDRLEGAINHASDRLDRLAGRLVSVLMPEAEEVARQSQSDREPEPPRSSLAGQIADHADRVRRLARLLDEIGDRVDL